MNEWNPYNDELYHYGTIGMKWGRRLYQYEDGSLTPLGKIRYRSAVKADRAQEQREARRKERAEKRADRKFIDEAHELNKRNVKKMSTEDLRKMKDRLQLEKDVLTLSDNVTKLTKNPNTEKGKKFVNDALMDAGKDIAKKTATGVGLYALGKAGRAFVSADHADDIEKMIRNGGPKN